MLITFVPLIYTAIILEAGRKEPKNKEKMLKDCSMGKKVTWQFIRLQKNF